MLAASLFLMGCPQAQAKPTSTNAVSKPKTTAVKIKKINLAQGDFEKTVSGLSAADKDIIKDLLRKSGIKVSD